MCNATHHKSLGTGLTAIHEIRRGIVYILENVVVFLFRC